MKHHIPVRTLHFDFDAVNPHWNPKDIEWSHMVNGTSLTMPYLEPFLVKTMREAIEALEDPDLIADAKAFVGQEAQHFSNHRRYNEMLKRTYPQLQAIEDEYEAAYQRLSQGSLEWRLAYSAGFETMTMGITEWLINDRDRLFRDADPKVASFALWHMVEETEHKSVAFEVYQAISGRYWLRMLGLVYGSLHVGLLARRAYKVMLQQDGRWQQPRSRLHLWRMVLRFLRKGGVAMLRAMSPWHHPDETKEPSWIEDWQQVQQAREPGELPLLETHSAQIAPVHA